MANLITSTSTNVVTATAILNTQDDMTEWVKLSHCICDGSANTDCSGTGFNYIHVRTPLPVNSSAGMGWNPYQIEVVGYHTYSGERWHDWTAIINTNGYTEEDFSGVVRINRGNTSSEPYVYKSANTYGGYKRVCFSMGKVTCCCTGYFWVRWRQNGISYRTQYAWATTHSNDRTALLF